MTVITFLKKYVLYLAWFQALTATLGSLFFSEVLKFPPCVLCWYQRMCLYPITVILAVGILRKDTKVDYYVWPFLIAGWLIALYHNLLYYSILPEAAAPCIAGISCTTRFIEWFGFITIPLLSLSAFTILGVFMIIYRKVNKS